MAVETIRVRQNTYDSWAEGQERVARGNRRGELVIMDFWTQLALDGRIFHMQAGTEDAPVNTSGTFDDTLAFFLVDCLPGWTFIPTYADANLATYAATTVPPTFCLEIDRAKVRYSANGTAFVPENLRTDRPRTSVAAAAYIGPDITAAAKTAVPGSIELVRNMFGISTAPTGTNDPTDFLKNGEQYNAAKGPVGIVVGTGSILVHWGCATADGTGYGSLNWAELPSEDVT